MKTLSSSFTVLLCIFYAHTLQAQSVFNKLKAHANHNAVKLSQVQAKYIQPTDTLTVNDAAGNATKATAATVLNFEKVHSVKLGDSVRVISKTDSRQLEQVLQLDKDEIGTMKVVPELFVNEDPATGKKKIYSVIFNEQAPMVYDRKQKHFHGNLSFFLVEEESDPASNSTTIADPIIMQIGSPIIELIDPNALSVKELYAPNTIHLTGEHVTDSAKIKIITRSHTKGYETFVKVRPMLEIIAPDSVLQGMGIQEAKITVRFLGSTSSNSVHVTLNASNGTLTPSEFDLKYNTPQQVKLRSAGVGKFLIRASTANDDAEVKGRYVFPWIFLLASIAGGLIGAFAKQFTGEGEKKLTAKPIIVGVLIGLLGAVAYYALGVNLLAFKTSETFNEFAVLGFSGLCAFFGLRKS